ncbi:hypothetical protein [Marispirochaeta sp.]|jgi:hypothetical protein|uniref:hypothetical protein n=1 Tax=Marispirochaeta sp. TaxID=2038653 RepID=UPI0029C62E40|nr:hypothetical protein [Marispirochaeta sp.]
MSKANRGSGIRDKVKSGRGACPLCKRSGIKVTYEVELKENKYMVCKQCKAALAHDKLQDSVAAL